MLLARIISTSFRLLIGARVISAMLSTTAKRKLIIDTDAGLDDAQAIMMVLADPNVELLALTTVTGNVHVDQVNVNVLRVLKLCNKLDIPVYQGSSDPLVGEYDKGGAVSYHGKDGLGDVPNPEVVDMSLIKSEPAVSALTRLVNQYPGEISLVAIGPLTNVAKAIRTDEKFGSKLKECYIMGGNYDGIGNITPYAEFNFYVDPEAANETLTKLGCPITIITWELCLRHPLTWEYYDTFIGRPHLLCKFIAAAENRSVTGQRNNNDRYRCSDQFAAAIAIDESVAEEYEDCRRFPTVRLDGTYEGMMEATFCDRGEHASEDNEKTNVRVVTVLDMNKFKSCLEKICSL
ncbi:uncharacterized protein LOC141914321 isoform X1 [Tubulanus polymorphus]|uniref:uncharacterized protein LOC141914321 isoform X1 n=1 Tax=Tubulanus polymorphus TaxID=672921 RepID=UPI003DA37768